MSQPLLNYYNLKDLDQNGKIIAEYIWIDGTGLGLRSKQRTLEDKEYTVATLPEWNYDGSSTYQAITENSEVILKPAAIFRDPFRGGKNILVMCEAWNWKDGKFLELIPANTNFRTFATKIFDLAKETKPWFGIE
jgi:glutamine synthetase